ncbi:MAG: acetate--CoA ligase family protein, partial [Candidatus Dormibacteraeota bacterium]|nr:acetate--CoA ligase family protein [Candidatus Dormibacteraeota bacterium]
MNQNAGSRTSMVEAIEGIMRPKSVAVIGASSNRRALGNQVLLNLRNFGFAGRVWCVHPRAGELEGFPVVPSVADLPDDLDVALVSVPAGGVAEVLAELDEHGCRSAVLPTAGFTGADQAAIEAAAARVSMPFNGPNCLGVFSVADRAPLWTPRFRMDLPAGNVTVISQSGSAAISITTSPGLGLARIISSGNETSITSADYLEWLATDDATDVVGLVMEGVRDADRFAAAVETVQTAGKAVVAMKVGRTPQGSRATQAHTGVLISRYDAYAAFFEKLGIPAVLDYDDMVAALQALAVRPLRACSGTHVGVLAISGGEGALACDLAVENGLTPAEFSGETARRLRDALPGVDGGNPVDIGATPEIERRKPGDALRAVLDDPGVDSVLVVQDAHERLAISPEHDYLEQVRTVVEVSRSAPKPIVLASSASAGIHPMLQEVVAGSPVPFVRGLRAGIMALRSIGNTRQEGPAPCRPDAPAGLEELRARLEACDGPVGYALTQRILAAYDLPAVPSLLVSDADQAVVVASSLGYPLVAKVASIDLPHRTEVGGVVTGIDGEAELREAILRIGARVEAAAPGARIEGYELQPQVDGGVEALIGFTAEPPLGAMVV